MWDGTMKKALLLATVIFLMVAVSNSYVLGENTKTKIIVLVNRTVVLPDDRPVTVYSGSPTFTVTGNILGTTLIVKSSCTCQKCMHYKAHTDNNDIININSCSRGSGSYSPGGYNTQHLYIDYLNITVRKTNPNCTSPHVEAWIEVEYTGDWISPNGEKSASGSAPISWQGVVLVAALLAIMGAVGKR